MYLKCRYEEFDNLPNVFFKTWNMQVSVTVLTKLFMYSTGNLLLDHLWNYRVLNRRLSLLLWNTAMPRLGPATRSNIIGRLLAGKSQTEVDRQFNIHQNTISGLFSGRSVMAWAAISYNRRISLVHIQGNLTAQRYRDNFLQPHVLNVIDRQREMLQWDNARFHTARVTMDFLTA